MADDTNRQDQNQTERRRRGSLHRVATVRSEQGVSLRSAAANMGITVSEARAQEEEGCDLTIRQLHCWADALKVPLVDLLVEPGNDLSEPIQCRARMVRVMKTVIAIVDTARDQKIRRMATMLRDQLLEMMPELESIKPWNLVGVRRSQEDVPPIMEHLFSDPAASESRDYE